MCRSLPAARATSTRSGPKCLPKQCANPAPARSAPARTYSQRCSASWTRRTLPTGFEGPARCALRCGEAAQLGHAGAAVGAALQILLQPREGRTGGDGGADLRLADLEAGADGALESRGAGERRLAKQLFEFGEDFGVRVAGGGELEAQEDLRSLGEGKRRVVEAR